MSTVPTPAAATNDSEMARAFAGGVKTLASSHAARSACQGEASRDCRQTEEAQRRLDGSGYVAFKQLQCESSNGTLVIHSRVPSYYHKQIAQTIVRGVGGINVIVNNLHVD